MAKPFPDDAKVKWAESKIGPRTDTAIIGYQHRTLLRTWIMGKTHLSYADISGLSIPKMSEYYRDVSDSWIPALTEKQNQEPTKTEPNEMPTSVETKDTVKKDSTSEVAQEIAKALSKLSVTGALDEKRVREIATEEARKVKAPERVIVVKEGKEADKQDVGIQHKSFPLLLKCLEAGLNVALVGPAGTGKTSAAHAVAQALKLPYECQSFSSTTTKSDLLGFVDANGNYRNTPFQRVYKSGGIWLGDEFDAGNANANVVLNAATANGVCSFPYGMENKHKDTLFVIAMNTYGQGANRQYVGRNQLDAATLDRFVFMDWDLDIALESAMVGETSTQEVVKLDKGGNVSTDKWLARVRAIRSAIEKQSVRHLVTPRAALFGVKLLSVGLGKEVVEDLVIWKGLDKEQKNRVLSAI